MISVQLRARTQCPPVFIAEIETPAASEPLFFSCPVDNGLSRFATRQTAAEGQFLPCLWLVPLGFATPAGDLKNK